MAQKETRAAAKVRLQAEGRWKEALSLRERLKAEGVLPAEAWRRMLEAFPPLPPGQSAAATPAEAVPESPPVKRRRCRACERNRGTPFNWEVAVTWVVAHLDPRYGDRGCPGPSAARCWTTRGRTRMCSGDAGSSGGCPALGGPREACTKWSIPVTSNDRTNVVGTL